MVNFLTVAAKHCRKAEHSLQLAAGFFNSTNFLRPELMSKAGSKTVESLKRTSILGPTKRISYFL
jgi:hypothetical protein